MTLLDILLEDGLTLSLGPMLLADVLALSFLVTVAVLLVAAYLIRGPFRGAGPLPKGPAGLGLAEAPRGLVWAGIAIWLVLLACFLFGLLWTLASLFLRGPAGDTPEKIAGDLRWYLLTLTALTAGLGGVVALPFTLIRTVLSRRQTVAQEDGLITDRINAAVLGLGAEKKVDRIGRVVTLKAPDGAARTVIEWQGQDLDKAEDEEEVGDPKDWDVFSETLPNLEVRIGAILALERIARNSHPDHVQIMQILCAYIRENSHRVPPKPAPALPPYPQIGAGDDPQKWDKWRREVRQEMENFRATLSPLIDVQTALDVLGRRREEQRKVEAAWRSDADHADPPWEAPFPDPPAYPDQWSPDAHRDWLKHLERYTAAAEAWRARVRGADGYRLDLRGANLQGYDLSSSGGNWQGARFGGAQMQEAVLWGARMQGANLWGARMQGANLAGAQMQGAVLWAARMQGADLGQAQMQGADLGQARMQGAGLAGAQMQGADLTLAQMQGAVLMRAQMQGTHLGKAQMQGAVLTLAQMQGADLWETEFDATNDLAGATLRGAGVRSVDFTHCDMDPDLLHGTFGDGSNTLPDAWDWPEGWAGRDEKLNDREFRARWADFRATLSR